MKKLKDIVKYVILLQVCQIIANASLKSRLFENDTEKQLSNLGQKNMIVEKLQLFTCTGITTKIDDNADNVNSMLMSLSKLSNLCK